MIGFGHPLSFNLKGVNSGPYDDFTVATSSSSSSSSSSPLPLSFSRRSSCRESLSERDPVSEASSEASESEGEDDEDDSLSRSFSSGMKITLKREEKHVGPERIKTTTTAAQNSSSERGRKRKIGCCDVETK